MPTFAKAASGSLVGFADATPTMRLCIAQATITRDIQIENVTQSGASGVANVPTFAGCKRYRYGIRGAAWYETTGDSGSTYSRVPLNTNMASLSGSILGRTSRMVLQRNTDLEDVTSSSDAVPTVVFSAGHPTYSGSASGYLQSTETPLDADNNTSPATLTIPLGVGTVAGAFLLSGDSAGMVFPRGNANQYDFEFVLSSTITNTTNPFSITSFSGEVKLNNGQTMSGTVIPYLLRTDLDWRKVGPVPFRFAGYFSDTVTFA